jgi:lysozyme
MMKPVPGRSFMTLSRGLDVSSYQGNVNWSAMRRRHGLTWSATKATQGVNYVNPYFHGNWSAMADAGLVRMAYHFADPSVSALAQARFFIAVVKPQPGDVLCLDLERSGGLTNNQVNAWVKTFATVIRATGCATVLYAGGNFTGSPVGDGVGGYFDRWWYPSYPYEPGTSHAYNYWTDGFYLRARTHATGWGKPHIWQFTDSLPTGQGSMDASVALISAAELATPYGAPKPAPKPKPKPVPKPTPKPVPKPKPGPVPAPKPKPVPVPVHPPAPAPKGPQGPFPLPVNNYYGVWDGKPVCHAGDRGNDAAGVKAIQVAVGATPDGSYGPATRYKVAAWQHARNLRADGLVGPVTWELMSGYHKPAPKPPAPAPRPPAPKPPNDGGPTGTFPLPDNQWYGLDDGTKFSHSGHRGNDYMGVKLIQRQVGVTPDGAFGPATHDRVVAYQRKAGMAVLDGKVGIWLWHYMTNH